MKGKIFRTIRAISTGLLLVGSTMAGASAAVLNVDDYPAPFLKDGKLNGVLVIGDKAAAEDVIGISDILADLQYKATGVGKQEVVEGPEADFWKVGTSTRQFEISEAPGTPGLFETIADNTPGNYISESELNLLKDGEATNNKGDSEYHQRLYFPVNVTTGYVQYTENDDDKTADFLVLRNGLEIARYELEFTTSLESDIDDASGSASTTGTFLTDFEDTQLNILGHTYSIVQARRITTAGDNIRLVLMGGTAEDSLNEGRTKTYKVKGKDYEVTLDFVNNDKVRFTVNGQTTRLISDGETDKLSDGTIIGVTDILYQDYAGGVHSARFFLGAQKIELKDSDVNDVLSSNSLKVEDNTIDDADVVIEGSDDDSTFKIERISVIMNSPDDVFIPAGGSLSQNSELDEMDLVFTRNWDIEYGGLTSSPANRIRIRTSGSDQYNLEFNDWSGNKVDLPLMNVPGGSTVKLGDDDDSLVLVEGETITKDDYFVVADMADQPGERPTYALRYRGADKDTSDNKVLKFDNLGTSERIEVPYSVGPFSATLKIGGGSYEIMNVSPTSADDFDINVDLNQDGSIDLLDFVVVTTNYGGEISIINGTPANVNVTFSTPNPDHVDDVIPTPLVLSLTGNGGEVDMNRVSGVQLISPDGSDDVSYGYTSYGAFIKFDEPSSGEPTLDITYPKNQRIANVYIKASNTNVSAPKMDTLVEEEVTPQKIQIGAAKLASEVKNYQNYNLLLVGGPCANDITAAVTGIDCESWPLAPGEAFVRYYDNAGNVAMLVAGTTKEDTRNAAKALLENKLSTSKDVKVYTKDKPAPINETA